MTRSLTVSVDLVDLLVLGVERGLEVVLGVLLLVLDRSDRVLSLPQSVPGSTDGRVSSENGAEWFKMRCCPRDEQESGTGQHTLGLWDSFVPKHNS